MLQDRVEVVRRALAAFVARISVNSAPCAVFAVPSRRTARSAARRRGAPSMPGRSGKPV